MGSERPNVSSKLALFNGISNDAVDSFFTYECSCATRYGMVFRAESANHSLQSILSKIAININNIMQTAINIFIISASARLT